MFIFLEVMDAGSVEDFAKANVGKLGEKVIKYVLWTLLKAISIMHKEGFVHRDIKSENALINKQGEIDYESIVKLSDGFNGADLRNVCTEAGIFAIRADRDYVVEEDMLKAARKLAANKKMESKLDYSKV